MKKLALFIILFVFSLSFATGWQQMSIIAIIISVMILGLIFAVGHIIDSNEMKFLAKDEMVQVIATILMIGAITSFAAFFSSLSTDASTSVDSSLQHIISANNVLGDSATVIGKEGSKSIWCSFSAVGFGTSACTGYRMVSPPISMSFQLTGVALAELNALKFLIDTSSTWIMNLLLPMGVFLRTFKYTRGAGSLFIATAVAFYFVLPVAYLAIHDMIVNFMSNNPEYSGNFSFPIAECDEYAIDNTQNEENVITAFSSATSSAFPKILYRFLIDATLTVVVSLVVTVSAIRFLMGIAGAEIDVQAIGRLI